MLDLVITDAVVVDGTGAPAFRGWVGVRSDRIAVVGHDGMPVPEAGQTIDAAGRVVAPGFIDVHNHSDLSPFVLATMPSVIRQGVTTVVVGNCGLSPWPLAGYREAIELAYADPAAHPVPSWQSFGDYLAAIDEAEPAVNVAALVGHGSIRLEVLGNDRRAPDHDELQRMRALVADSLDAGAVGLSTGLIYTPGIHATTDEVIALAEESATRGGIYASHIRGEGRDLFQAVDEALEIGRRAQLPVHVSHLKCESSRVWGRAEELLERIHGADATGDQYPYAAWNSSLASLFPPWAPPAELERVARDAATRDRLRRAVEEGEDDFQSSIDGVGWDRIAIVGTKDHRWRGLDVATIAEKMGFDPFAAALRLLVEDPSTSCIGHAMHDDDVRTIVSDPEVFVASDGSAIDPTSPAGSLPVHPRDYGTFPRVLASYVREEGVLSLEAAVRKMTSLPADRFGLTERGRIADGAFADLVVFDPGTVSDRSTYASPHRFPSGIAIVVVNGAVAFDGAAILRAGGAMRPGGSATT
jgi:N-acyl-D-aspartate/D-glutamate deacylase